MRLCDRACAYAASAAWAKLQIDTMLRLSTINAAQKVGGLAPT